MRILFHVSTGGPDYAWGPWSLADGVGLGGSETCVVELARHLRVLGHEVTVSNNCHGQREGFYDGVRYVNALLGEALPECDVVIAQRDWQLLERRIAPIQLLYCHDVPVPPHCPTDEEIAVGALANIDGVLLLNDYHAGLYARIPESKKFVLPIGIDHAPFQQPFIERIPGRCIYLSHPHRGLGELRYFWPQIKAQVPHATLQACWWEPQFFDEYPPNGDLGILPMKRCGADDLAQEILRADLFTYTSTFGAEISPAATILAQAGGAVPAVICAGGMHETVKFGHKATWVSFPMVVTDALLDRSGLEEIRPQMMAWAREIYAWDATAKRLETIIGSIAPAMVF